MWNSVSTKMNYKLNFPSSIYMSNSLYQSEYISYSNSISWLPATELEGLISHFMQLGSRLHPSWSAIHSIFTPVNNLVVWDGQGNIKQLTASLSLNRQPTYSLQTSFSNSYVKGYFCNYTDSIFLGREGRGRRFRNILSACQVDLISPIYRRPAHILELIFFIWFM